MFLFQLYTSRVRLLPYSRQVHGNMGFLRELRSWPNYRPRLAELALFTAATSVRKGSHGAEYRQDHARLQSGILQLPGRRRCRPSGCPWIEFFALFACESDPRVTPDRISARRELPEIQR